MYNTVLLNKVSMKKLIAISCMLLSLSALAESDSEKRATYSVDSAKAMRCSLLAVTADDKNEAARLFKVAAVYHKAYFKLIEPELGSEYTRVYFKETRTDPQSYFFGSAHRYVREQLDKEIPIPQWAPTREFEELLAIRKMKAVLAFHVENCNLIK